MGEIAMEINFQPTVIAEEGLYRYRDGRVNGVIDFAENSLVIYEWTSTYKGMGHTRAAVEWFRENGYTSITAYNIGMPPEPGCHMDDSVSYWLAMKDKGLVQHLIDDDGFCFDESFRNQKTKCNSNDGLEL